MTLDQIVQKFIANPKYISNGAGLEEFEDIPGYEDIYKISMNAAVLSLPRIPTKKWYKSRKTIQILKPQIDKGGYLRVNLSKKGKVSNYLLHRLVAMVFIPNPLGLPEINHKDGNPANNSIDNLEWCTGEHNVNHAYNTGLNPSGERHINARLSDLQVYEIRSLYEKGDYTQKQLGEMYNVSREHARDIIKFKKRKRTLSTI